MQTLIPSTRDALSSLLKADFTTQWRNRRSVILTLIVPLIILITWKSLIKYLGGPFILSNSITIGLVASGLMAYSNSIARDRDKGIFQRLRVAPIPSWAIMVSRLIVQLALILVITTMVFIVGKQYDEVSLSITGYILTYFIATVGCMLYLSLGQLIVGAIKNPETVNSTSRLVYFLFILVGMFGEISMQLNKYGKIFHDCVYWSPYGTVKTILAAAMEPGKWTNTTTYALLVTLGYTIVFTFFGLKWFKWNTK